MKFDQLIENIFMFPLYIFLYFLYFHVPLKYIYVFQKNVISGKSRWSAAYFNIFRLVLASHTINTDCVELQTIDPEICSILIFQRRVQQQFLHHILCMTFHEKCFLCYVLLTDQISLSECFTFTLLFETLDNMCIAIFC